MSPHPSIPESLWSAVPPGPNGHPSCHRGLGEADRRAGAEAQPELHQLLEAALVRSTRREGQAATASTTFGAEAGRSTRPQSPHPSPRPARATRRDLRTQAGALQKAVAPRSWVKIPIRCDTKSPRSRRSVPTSMNTASIGGPAPAAGSRLGRNSPRVCRLDRSARACGRS